ncbi:hypothetical protein TSTA_071900 [Talaromyces stipitatus ATCC 10500]|uniref:Uncharacterized protein n=1 Tax=Talaromyces stipitatus (strain ATCC 10500 / CBS 375.48 / QM 6759 / NRRL 1006) TaxID=441959 RepID=B8LTW4_TALSN|nr:uncharacterized protein TSTA_071900 [Talaromyces stipitatus ATCC 10500]EED23794.1 hypothetical protein TSTA_071900 [Talaromyces stipitatus ATCC 10500]
MSSEYLLAVNPDKPLFTDAEQDTASVPKNCFIRSFLSRIKTHRFKYIAPGLEAPHDASQFAARQKFTGLPRARDKDHSRTVPFIDGSDFHEEIKQLFFVLDDPVPYSDTDPIPTGLFSEPVDQEILEIAEDGFRLLPF